MEASPALPQRAPRLLTDGEAGLLGRLPYNLSEHKMTHLPGCRAWLGTQMSRLSQWGTCHGKGRWKAHAQPGFRLKTESSEGFWVCSACFRTAPRGTRRGHRGRRTEPWFEPGPLHPPARDIHPLLSTGGLREQAPLCLSVSAPLRAPCRGLGAWWLIFACFSPSLAAGPGLWNQVYGDQREGQHQRGERESRAHSAGPLAIRAKGWAAPSREALSQGLATASAASWTDG